MNWFRAISAQHILRLVEGQLLTPVGLRTLSPQDSRIVLATKGVLGTGQRLPPGHRLAVLAGPLCDGLDEEFGRNAKTKQRGHFSTDWKPIYGKLVSDRSRKFSMQSRPISREAVMRKPGPWRNRYAR